MQNRFLNDVRGAYQWGESKTFIAYVKINRMDLITILIIFGLIVAIITIIAVALGAYVLSRRNSHVKVYIEPVRVSTATMTFPESTPYDINIVLVNQGEGPVAITKVGYQFKGATTYEKFDSANFRMNSPFPVLIEESNRVKIYIHRSMIIKPSTIRFIVAVESSGTIHRSPEFPLRNLYAPAES